MATRQQDLQRIARHYRDVTGKKEIDHREVAAWAVSRQLLVTPPPVDPIDRLSKEFSRAAREEIRHDAETGRPYRANHAVTVTQGSRQTTLWFDIDDNPPRAHMKKSLVQRREQMVGDALQLSFDMDHWNAINPNESPIDLPLDLTDDVQWAKNTPRDDESAAG